MIARLLALVVAAALAAAAVALLACGETESPEGREGMVTDTKETARQVVADFFRPDPDRIPHDRATNPGTPWGDHLGSGACQACHVAEYAGWRDSFHSRTLYDATEATVIGDFSGGSSLDDPTYFWTVRPFSKDGKFWMEIRKRADRGGRKDPYGAGVPAQPEGVFEVVYAFGNRRHQPYVARGRDGTWWVLPTYWNDVTKSWMLDGWRPYVTSCAHCHVSGIQTLPERTRGADEMPMTNPRRWNMPAGQEGWAEGAVGCEVCHGPGRPHVDAVQRMGNDGYRAYLSEGGAPTIYNPKNDTPERRMQQCDMCHNFHSESQVTFVPKAHGYDHEMMKQPLAPRPGQDGQFWPDGTHMSPCTVGRVFRESPMGKKGVECRDCHESHGNRDWAELLLPIEGNRLCLSCHTKRFPDDAAVANHTRHPIGGPGSLCTECHMPRDKRFSNGIQVMSAQIHSHAMSTPTGDESPLGPGPACNVCHTDRDAAWTKRVLRAWKDGTTPPK